MSGTVNISRSIWRDAAFKDQPFTEREAFMWIIMEASYTSRERRIGNITVNLERGQLATSVRFMCEAWSWSKSTVDRFLKRLEKRDMIGTDSGTGINVITVCKYSDYQNAPKGTGTAKPKKRDSSGTAAGQQRDKPNTELIQELIPDAMHIEADAKPPPKKRACSIPENWVPNDKNIEHALSKQMTHEEIQNEADRFRDHHLAKGTTFKDWDAGWRTWVANSIKFKGSRMAGRQGSNGFGQGGGIAGAVARRHLGG